MGSKSTCVLRWPFLSGSPREPDAGSGRDAGRRLLPSQQRRGAEPTHGSGIGLPPLQTPGLAQHPRLPCSRPRGPSEGEPRGASTMTLLLQRAGRQLPGRAAHPTEPAPGHLHLHGARGPQQAGGPQGGQGSTRGDRGPEEGTAEAVPESPATACTPQVHTFPHTLKLTCTHRLTPEPQAEPGYP